MLSEEYRKVWFSSNLSSAICECSTIGIMHFPVTEEGTGSSPVIRAKIILVSSSVEQVPVKDKAVGSIPTLGAMMAIRQIGKVVCL